MLYGLESEAKAILKYENETMSKVCSSGLWVNPKFPFLACSPDGLVSDDTVIKIKSLKILKKYSVQTVTSPTTPVPKEVLSRQCFCVKDGKCVLKRTHAYYYQCQHILLVTERKHCDFLLYAENGPNSVERIPRDESVIEKILQFLTTLWMKVIAPEIFEMRVPRDLLPFILPDMSSGTFDNMETADIDTSSPATPGDHREPVSEGSSLTETTCPPVSPLHDVSSHTQDEIHVAEALLSV